MSDYHSLQREMRQRALRQAQELVNAREEELSGVLQRHAEENAATNQDPDNRRLEACRTFRTWLNQGLPASVDDIRKALRRVNG